MSGDYAVWVPSPRGEPDLTGLGPDDVRILVSGAPSPASAAGVCTTHGPVGGVHRVEQPPPAAPAPGGYVLGPRPPQD
ncbi:MAG: hypothetical protein R2731_19750 [Nocardioides sp.]